MYATQQDLIDRYGTTEIARLTAAEGADPTSIDTGRATVALTDATAVVDSYLRAQVPVPLSTVPPEVVRVTCVLARYNLAHGEGREPTEQMRLAQKEAMDWLRDVATGTVQLGLIVPEAGAKGGRSTDRERVLSTDSLQVYV